MASIALSCYEAEHVNKSSLQRAVESVYTEDLQLQKQVICDKKIENVMFFKKFFVPGAVKALKTFSKEKSPQSSFFYYSNVRNISNIFLSLLKNGKLSTLQLTLNPVRNMLLIIWKENIFLLMCYN